jgi:2-polyprenyl-3-methyl-5-hydroxy-6-metoxy-1,4-benzoquinol methylase
MQKIKEECPLCQEDNWSFLYFSTHNKFNLPIYVCNTCSLQTIHPKDNINLEEIYSESYYNGKSEYNYKDERKTEYYDAFVWDARIHNIKKYSKTGNFLDVGSSFGGFLSRAKLAGFDVFGVEVSKYSSEYAKSKGIETFCGSYLDNKYPDNYFDVITLIEVIEHLEKPREVFQKLFKQLRTGGLLVIQTANFEGKQAIREGSNYHYYLPGHLYYYSKSILEKILIKEGFSRSIMYYGVDFPLSSKLLKSRGSFKSLGDYKKWWNISKYHLQSKFIKGSTSSMVLYGIK